MTEPRSVVLSIPRMTANPSPSGKRSQPLVVSWSVTAIPSRPLALATLNISSGLMLASLEYRV